ncbi:hypothetical protein BIY22_15980 [Vibrio panuliri]|uniref:Uncharacterized protein n=1 Tax=Vibrio panuliri TaxID=1381081 RepID=A0A1Q9HND3_9VIBR|nr:hypothetical protein [Vibrio panuliri]OLQ92311.1 hypothetical protein BIY22_15980 [Vibrio panuliri]
MSIESIVSELVYRTIEPYNYTYKKEGFIHPSFKNRGSHELAAELRALLESVTDATMRDQINHKGIRFGSKILRLGNENTSSTGVGVTVTDAPLEASDLDTALMLAST